MAFDAFLKIDGIPGESTDDKHKDWIEILSYSFDIDQPSSATDSSAGGGNLAAPRLIQVTGGNNFVLYQVTLKNAPKFHVVIDSTDGYRVWGITINTPPDSPNTDGVDPGTTDTTHCNGHFNAATAITLAGAVRGRI
jgi:polygalacturonase